MATKSKPFRSSRIALLTATAWAGFSLPLDGQTVASEKSKNGVKAVGGVWNNLRKRGVSEHSPCGSNPETHGTAFDPMGGLSVGFAKSFTRDVTPTQFVEYIFDVPDSEHLETHV